MTTQITPPAPLSVEDPRRDAFDRTTAHRAALDKDAIVPFQLDPVHAHTQALAIDRRLEPYRPTLAQLPELDLDLIARFMDHANALLWVYETLRIRAERMRQLPDLTTEGYALRKILLAYADLLVLQGVFDQDLIEELRAGFGYRDLLGDLRVIVRLFRADPSLTGPGAPVRAAQVNRANELADAIALELGVDEESDLSHAELIDARNRSAHLLLASHKEIRRAVEYLRFHQGDAATIVPSLYVPQKSRRKTPDEPSADEHAELAALHDALHDRHAAVDPELNPFVDVED